MREHGEILEALSRRDGVRLRRLLEEHLRHRYEALIASAEKGAQPGGGETQPAAAMPR